MQTQTHTPGPWEVMTGPGWDGTGTIAGAGESTRLVCTVNDWGFPDETAGNLALIAAAPALLAALETILLPSPHYGATQAHRDYVDAARVAGLAAIAAAKGA